MKVTIVTIGTGKYREFIPPLIQSIRQFMFVGHDLHTLVLADGEIPGHDHIHIDALPYPLNTVLKFNYISTLALTSDLVYFIDSDCRVVSSVGDEIVPNRGEIAVVKHPWHGTHATIYESNPQSVAYVSDNKGIQYCQGCFFGGYTNDVLEMSSEIATNVKVDLKTRIIAKWYDESYLNRYIIDHPFKLLNEGYAYPDPALWHQTFPAEPKILHFNYGSVK